MATLSAQGPIALHGATSEVHTSAYQAVGSHAFDAAGNEYVYVDFQESCVAGEWVIWDENYLASQLTSTLVGFVGVVCGIVSASDRFGWAQVRGIHNAAYVTSGSSVGPVVAYVTTDVGAIMSGTAGTGGIGVFGVAIMATPDTCATTGTDIVGTSLHGETVVALNYPFVTGAAVSASS